MAAPTLSPPSHATPGGVGTSARRPDGTPKVRGEFSYSSDLHPEDALWGATLRSPHPHARIRSIDISEALAMPGVYSVVTHEDVPGRNAYGMHVTDQPVLASDVVRFQGEPVAVVAADHPETARRAAARIVVGYEILQPLCDPERALVSEDVLVHPAGNLLRHVKIRHGDVEWAFRTADVVVTGDYEIGMQDQAFLGPESGLAVPHDDGSVDLFVASQHIHEDRDQIAACLGLPPDRVRVILAGVGGAFGGREDLSMHVHACLLALRTRRPVQMVYSREESFFGHVHRHPARIRLESAATRDGKIVGVRARLLLDGGAYASTSQIVIANASYFAAGAYAVDNVSIDGYAVYTHNPPCGAMRGFGAVQACYAIESHMDKLARALGTDPVQLRLDNALAVGAVLPTGQAVDGPAPVAQLLRLVQERPLPEGPGQDLRTRPGGVGNVTHGEGVRRGVGYALGMKAIGFSGGVDDTSTARVILSVLSGTPLVEVHSAAAECGQGILAVQAQIARTELGVAQVLVAQADTSLPDAGCSSASRQTWMTGGAVQGACERVRAQVLQRASKTLGVPISALVLAAGSISDRATGQPLVALAELLGAEVIEASFEYHHRQTQSIDPETGQGDAHIAFAFAAHRAVVDVDVDLGLVRVVELATAQDVGKAINPLAVEGQIEGGSAQGLGLALLEEVQVEEGRVRNPSFTDYLIPTILDMPPVQIDLLELPHPDSPYGLNGVGEPPTLSSTPAIMNAVRAAVGLDLVRVPLRPDHIVAAAIAKRGDAHAAACQVA
ncbi:MAG: xanthine dehydrogenase subunit D [Acidimicrobiales bacterium]